MPSPPRSDTAIRWRRIGRRRRRGSRGGGGRKGEEGARGRDVGKRIIVEAGIRKRRIGYVSGLFREIFETEIGRRGIIRGPSSGPNGFVRNVNGCRGSGRDGKSGGRGRGGIERTISRIRGRNGYVGVGVGKGRIGVRIWGSGSRTWVNIGTRTWVLIGSGAWV